MAKKVASKQIKKESIVAPVIETADDVRARRKAHQKSIRIRR